MGETGCFNTGDNLRQNVEARNLLRQFFETMETESDQKQSKYDEIIDFFIFQKVHAVDLGDFGISDKATEAVQQDASVSIQFTYFVDESDSKLNQAAADDGFLDHGDESDQESYDFPIEVVREQLELESPKKKIFAIGKKANNIPTGSEVSTKKVERVLNHIQVTFFYRSTKRQGKTRA